MYNKGIVISDGGASVLGGRRGVVLQHRRGPASVDAHLRCGLLADCLHAQH